MLDNKNTTVLNDLYILNFIHENSNTKHKFVSSKEVMAKRFSLKKIVDEYERKIICSILQQEHWNISKTAEYLKIPRTTLIHKISKHAIKQKNPQV